MADEIIVTLPKPLEDVETVVLLPPDIYEAEFIEADKLKGPKDDYLRMNAQIYNKDGRTATRCYDNLSLAENAEWKLKKVLISMGMSNPKGRKLDVKKTMLHRRFWAEVTIEEYEHTNEDGSKVKRRRNGISDYLPIAEGKRTPPSAAAGPAKGKETEVENGEEVSFG